MELSKSSKKDVHSNKSLASRNKQKNKRNKQTKILKETNKQKTPTSQGTAGGEQMKPKVSRR